MKIRKVVKRTLGEESDGRSVAGGLNAVIAANVNELGTSHVSSKQRVRVVQRDGKTEVTEDTEILDESDS